MPLDPFELRKDGAALIQSLLRNQRERGEYPDMDRRVGLRAGGDHTQAVATGGQSLPSATDSEHHAFRENAHFMRPSGHRRGSQFRRKRQPTDSLRLLTGQQWVLISIFAEQLKR